MLHMFIWRSLLSTASYSTFQITSFGCIVQARAMMLTSMDTNRRRRVLKAMKHEQSAAILVSMNHASRKSILEDLDANGDMHRTIDVIRYSWALCSLSRGSIW